MITLGSRRRGGRRRRAGGGSRGGGWGRAGRRRRGGGGGRRRRRGRSGCAVAYRCRCGAEIRSPGRHLVRPSPLVGDRRRAVGVRLEAGHPIVIRSPGLALDVGIRSVGYGRSGELLVDPRGVGHSRFAGGPRAAVAIVGQRAVDVIRRARGGAGIPGHHHALLGFFDRPEIRDQRGRWEMEFSGCVVPAASTVQNVGLTAPAHRTGDLVVVQIVAADRDVMVKVDAIGDAAGVVDPVERPGGRVVGRAVGDSHHRVLRAHLVEEVRPARPVAPVVVDFVEIGVGEIRPCPRVAVGRVVIEYPLFPGGIVGVASLEENGIPAPDLDDTGPRVVFAD